MAPSALPSRHHLVWLLPSWRDSLLAPLLPSLLPLAAAWLERGLPAVACRSNGSLAEGAVALGIAFRPSPERRRASLLVARRAVAGIEEPLRLTAVVGSAPARWRAALGELDESARDLGLTLRVYGSLAWQHLSGDEYVTEESDADLLVEPQTQEGLARALRLFRSRASLAEPRLDGEILLSGGRAVSWREVLAAPRRILVKSLAGASLVPLRDALGSMGAVEGVS